MALQLRILILIGCLIALYTIIHMIKKENLELKYALSWIGASFAILIIAVFPRIIEVLADYLGIISPMNGLFFLGIVFNLLIIFSITVAQSRSSKRIKELVQKVALLEEEIATQLEMIKEENHKDVS